MRVMRVVGEEMCRLCPEENCGRGSAGKLPAVPTFSMRLHGDEFEATAHCSTRSDRAGQVRIMQRVVKCLRLLQSAAAIGPGSSEADVLSNMHSDTVL